MEAGLCSPQTRNRGHRKAFVPRSPIGSCLVSRRGLSGGIGGQAERHPEPSWLILTRAGSFSLVNQTRTGPWVWWGKGQGVGSLVLQTSLHFHPVHRPGGSGLLLLLASLRSSTLSREEAWEFQFRERIWRKH